METSIYIHFPFCSRKCHYCDFNSSADSAIVHKDYVAALLHEMELTSNSFPGETSSPTLYIGGGTPSLLEPHLVARLIEAAQRLYSLEADAEITMEVNPGTVDRHRLESFHGVGVNRLSIGIQSFSDPMLELLGRIHSARQGIECFHAAREAGFNNIGIDLIHSLPGQSLAMWQRELERAARLRPEHISAYALSVEPGTAFHAKELSGDLQLPDEEEGVSIFELTSSYLQRQGYEHYEISNYALPGFRSRHNQVYWQRGNYLGIGAGAHSFLRYPAFGCRWKNPDSPSDYMEMVVANNLPDKADGLLDRHDAMFESLFLGLRLLDGISMERFRDEFGITLHDAFPGCVNVLISDGLLCLDGPRLRLSPRGIILSNQVFASFI